MTCVTGIGAGSGNQYGSAAALPAGPSSDREDSVRAELPAVLAFGLSLAWSARLQRVRESVSVGGSSALLRS
eukprot:12472041-Prorocentrum_lima.AAC.1